MNGLRPLMPRSEPAGRGGAGCAGGGRRRELRACTTAEEGCASRWPISVLTPATPTATAPVIRNRRRSGGGQDAAEVGAGPDETQEAPGGVRPASVGAVAASPAVLARAVIGSGRPEPVCLESACPEPACP